MSSFPKLPSDILRLLPAETIEMEALCQAPDTWNRLAPDKLGNLLFHACFTYSLLPENDRVEPLQDLMSVVVERLDRDSRLAVLRRLVDYFDNARINKRRPLGGNAFFAFMYDPDAQVASSGALNAAVWLGDTAEQAEFGRRTVLDFAIRTPHHNERAARLAGLAALGDPLSNDWIRPLWMEATPDGQRLICSAATATQSTASVDFLINLCDDALDLSHEQLIGTPLGAIGKIALTASGQMDGPYSGRGIAEIHRHFPAWTAGDADVVSVTRWWTTREYAELVIPRLESLSKRERSEPKVIPTIISYWN